MDSNQLCRERAIDWSKMLCWSITYVCYINIILTAKCSPDALLLTVIDVKLVACKTITLRLMPEVIVPVKII